MNTSYSKTFTHLFCRSEQCLTPHWAGRVLGRTEDGLELELHCRRCGHKSSCEVDILPTSHRVYQVRVTGEDHSALPARMRPLPWLEESFAVVATSAQHAHEVAELAHRTRFGGHLVKYYVNGELHLNERF